MLAIVSSVANFSCLPFLQPVSGFPSPTLLLLSLFKGKKDALLGACLSDFWAFRLEKFWSSDPGVPEAGSCSHLGPTATRSSEPAFQAQARLDWIQGPNYHQKIKER